MRGWFIVSFLEFFFLLWEVHTFILKWWGFISMLDCSYFAQTQFEMMGFLEGGQAGWASAIRSLDGVNWSTGSRTHWSRGRAEFYTLALRGKGEFDKLAACFFLFCIPATRLSGECTPGHRGHVCLLAAPFLFQSLIRHSSKLAQDNSRQLKTQDI